MRTTLASVAFFFTLSLASAQTLMPARQVTYTPGSGSQFTGPTVQAALDSYQRTTLAETDPLFRAWTNDVLPGILGSIVLTEEDPLFTAWRTGYTGTLAQIIAELPTGGATTLNELTDVSAPSPGENQVLRFVGSSWVPSTITEGGGGAVVLNDLQDVNATDLQNNHVLKYSTFNNAWIAGAVATTTTVNQYTLAGTNFIVKLNEDFRMIGQDLLNIDAYLIGPRPWDPLMGARHSGGTAIVYNVDFVEVPVGDVVFTNAVIVPIQTNVFLSLEQMYAQNNFTDGALVPTLQYNQNITKTNFTKVNDNTFLTTNLFAALGSMLDIDNTNTLFYDAVRSSNYWAWVDAFQQMDTNYAELPLDLALNFPSIFTPYTESLLEEVDTRINLAGLGSNFLVKLNQDFGTVAQDFRNLDAFLVATPGVSDGWSVEYTVETQTNVVDGVSYVVDVVVPVSSNRFFTVGQYYDDPEIATNLTLAGSLQLNQDIAQTNFIRINDNLDVNTNLFTAVRQVFVDALGIDTTNFNVSGGFDDWLNAYTYMDTEFATVPTNLVSNFPNLWDQYTEEHLTPVEEFAQGLVSGFRIHRPYAFGGTYQEGNATLASNAWNITSASFSAAQGTFFPTSKFYSQNFGAGTLTNPEGSYGKISAPGLYHYNITVAGYSLSANQNLDLHIYSSISNSNFSADHSLSGHGGVLTPIQLQFGAGGADEWFKQSGSGSIVKLSSTNRPMFLQLVAAASENDSSFSIGYVEFSVYKVGDFFGDYYDWSEFFTE